MRGRCLGLSGRSTENPGKVVEPRVNVELIPTTIRLPRDIYDALEDIVLFEHKTSISDLTRDWIVEKALSFLRNPTYQKWLRKKHEAGK